MNGPNSDFYSLSSPRRLDFLNEINHLMKAHNHRNSEAVDSTNFLADLQRLNLASGFAKRLLLQITQFDAELDADHEVGMKLVSFGQSITFHVSDVGYYNPSLILFIGLTEDGNRVELVQHVSQISFLLTVLPKLHPEKPKRKIGFIQENTPN